MNIKIQLQHQCAKIPTYATDGSACFDLYAATVGGVEATLQAAMNIEKLRKRYPNRYQHDLAAFRADKQMEILE